MSKNFISSMSLPDFPLWENIRKKRGLLSFELEITARCNNNCRHCYINLPAADRTAKKKELSVVEIKEIAEEAVSLGAMWCLVTGGEPLLRDDFAEIYLALKRKGLLVSVFTNATLINKDHIQLFKKYPPRDIEVTVYGVTEATYERVTRSTGSFEAFMRGLDLLIKSGIKVRLKAVALKSNLAEMHEISRFCRERTKDIFRFDPFLHLRFDGNLAKNKEIKDERPSPEQIVTLEWSDPERSAALKKGYKKLIFTRPSRIHTTQLFSCGSGNNGFTVSYNALFRLCSSLWHPDCLYDLRSGSLSVALNSFVPKVRNMQSNRQSFLENCRICPLINLCMFCPAHAHLETGELDAPVGYFCEVAHARATEIKAQRDTAQNYKLD